MSEIETQRAFKHRLLDGFERSRLRSEVQRSKRSHMDRLKRRYATMILGASLAVGGIGVPMKLANPPEPAAASQQKSPSDMFSKLSEDLLAAQSIALEVTSGVDAAARTVAKPLEATVNLTASESMKAIREAAREEFFKKEVPFGQIIYNEAKKNDLAPELVAAVVQQESRFIPTARSHAGAQGLMQLVPRTGKWMGANNLMNPTENVRAGTKYLKYLNGRFDGDQTMVIAAYNAGEGNVKRFRGVPPFKETQKYLRNVISFEQEYRERLNGKLAETLETRIASASGVSQ